AFTLSVQLTPSREASTLALRDALPICQLGRLGLGEVGVHRSRRHAEVARVALGRAVGDELAARRRGDRELDDVRTLLLEAQALRSEEHTSELQSRGQLVCRLLLEKKNR